jgi:hypothetical protein
MWKQASTYTGSSMQFNVEGTLVEFPDEAATIIAEDYRRLKTDERWQEIADPIEALLVGEVTGPLKLTEDNSYLMVEPLNVLLHGPYEPQARELLDAITAAYDRRRSTSGPAE